MRFLCRTRFIIQLGILKCLLTGMSTPLLVPSFSSKDSYFIVLVKRDGRVGDNETTVKVCRGKVAQKTRGHGGLLASSG